MLAEELAKQFGFDENEEIAQKSLPKPNDQNTKVSYVSMYPTEPASKPKTKSAINWRVWCGWLTAIFFAGAFFFELITSLWR